MRLEDAFASGVCPKVFFEEKLPALLGPYLERFTQLSEVEVTVAVRLTGAGGGEWTLTFSDEALNIEEGEGFEDPVITALAKASDWEPFRAQVLMWAQNLQRDFDTRLEEGIEPHFRLTPERFKALRKIEGTMRLSVEGVPGHDGEMSTTYFFNTFADEGARVLEIGVEYEDLVAFLQEGATFDQLYSANRLKMRGNMALPMKIAGVFMAY